MQIYENYNNAPIMRRMIAVAGCIVLGIIIMLLSIIAAAGESELLLKGGFCWYTIPCYAIVVVCGFLILSRVRYAALVAAIVSALELVAYFCVQLSTHPEVEWPFMIKILVIVACLQLVILIDSFEEDEEEQPPAIEYHRGPAAPQPRRNIQRNAPRPKR